ncbi:YkvA family protein [Smaragdicoccus niigatensis]|uniref:YkvA family protein n=1 Tax=Smaragdicoccus niigatensis TaxID=359359 RepID=UPI00037F8B2D
MTVTGSRVFDVLVDVVIALILLWIVMIVALAVIRPKGVVLRDAMRILPDLLRLIRRLSADRSQPRGVRVRLGLLMVYLALPIDLVPDFIPVLGYADDAIIVAWVLRSIVRRVGIDAVRDQWPGSDAGFETVRRICRLT